MNDLLKNWREKLARYLSPAGGITAIKTKDNVLEIAFEDELPSTSLRVIIGFNEIENLVENLLASSRQQVIGECVKAAQELWLEGIDHPYDTISYNRALNDVISHIKKL